MKGSGKLDEALTHSLQSHNALIELIGTPRKKKPKQ